MYKILIKDAKNVGLYRFLTVKKEVTKEVKTEVEDPDTHEIKTEITYEGTGEYEVVEYAVESKDELEKKCVELLNSYKATDFMPVDTLKYTTDLIWDSDKETE